MKLFDSHTHLNYEEFDEAERNFRIKEIEEDENIGYVMDVGCDMETSKLSCDHSDAYPWCYGAVGFHPYDAEDLGDVEISLLKSMAAKEGIKAIGEIGLDYHYDDAPKEAQREAYRKQIRLALELKMPIIIHSRDADQETMDILKEEGAFSDERKALFPKRPVPEGWESAAEDARVLIHCFSSSKEIGKQYVKLGATLSISGTVTYPNNRRTVEAVEEIPIDFLLVETDAPFLTPAPMHDKPNRTPYIIHTARRVGVIKNMDLEDVAEITCKNTKRFFNI